MFCEVLFIQVRKSIFLMYIESRPWTLFIVYSGDILGCFQLKEWKKELFFRCLYLYEQ